jgi:hypothetical protein
MILFMISNHTKIIFQLNLGLQMPKFDVSKRNYRLVMNFIRISVGVRRVLHAKRTLPFFSIANNPLITTQTIHILLSWWPMNLLHLNVSKVNLSCLMSTYHQISDSAKLTILNPIGSLVFLLLGSYVLRLHPVRTLANVHLFLFPCRHPDMSNALKYLVFMGNLTTIFKTGYSC